jgi:hypothetical protein
MKTDLSNYASGMLRIITPWFADSGSNSGSVFGDVISGRTHYEYFVTDISGNTSPSVFVLCSRVHSNDLAHDLVSEKFS